MKKKYRVVKAWRNYFCVQVWDEKHTQWRHCCNERTLEDAISFIDREEHRNKPPEVVYEREFDV